MSNGEKARTYHSHIFCHEMPNFDYALVDQYIKVPDFDLFEDMCWRTNVAEHCDANHQARKLRDNGVLTLAGTGIVDGPLRCRQLVEKHQIAFERFVRHLSELEAAREQRSKAKTKLPPHWQSTIRLKSSQFDLASYKVPLDKLDQGTFESVHKAFSRLYGYRATAQRLDLLEAMYWAAFSALAKATDELEARVGSLHSSLVNGMLKNNIMCARNVLKAGGPSQQEDRDESRASGELSCVTQFLIEDRWEQYSDSSPKVERKFWFDE